MARTMLGNLAAIAQNTQTDNIKMIDIDELHESADNFFVIERIEEFAETILGQGGVKDNLIVRPLESGGYEVISGHRRRAAVQYLLDRGDTVSRYLPCLIQDYADDQDRLLDLILMNVSARQLSDRELWQAYEILDTILKEKKSAGEKFGRVRETLAQTLGVSPAQVGKMQNVASHAIEPVKDAVANGDISISTANEIAKLDAETQEELASGDLAAVKPKEIKKAASPDTEKREPATVGWDGEIYREIVKQQLMHLATEKLRENAAAMSSMEFTNEFRKENRSHGFSFVTGISTDCSFDRIAISFLNPEKFDNIRTIEMTWRMAAKCVQEWIQEEAADSSGVEADDLNAAEPGLYDDAAEVDTSINFSGEFESIVTGYMTKVLQMMGMNQETIQSAQQMMKRLFELEVLR